MSTHAYPVRVDATLDEGLSRWLWLFKWLLAIPHFLVLALLWPAFLVLSVAALVAIVFTGRYPRGIFDFNVGVLRWSWRVGYYAYSGLGTDHYPPFRLDMGGADPGSVLVAPPPTAERPVVGPTPPSGGRDWGIGRVLAVVVASIMLITSAGLLVSGLVLRVADSAARDADGYLTTSGMRLESPGYALTSEELSIEGEGTWVELPQRLLGTVKVEAIGLAGNGVFVGIGHADDVDDYLDGVAASVVTDPAGDDGESPTYEFTDGGSPRAAPADETFWVASATGEGQQAITWEPGEGDWTLVVMSGEGTTPVEAEVEIGATVPVLDDVAYGLLVGGGLLLLAGGLVLWLAVRTRQP